MLAQRFQTLSSVLAETVFWKLCCFPLFFFVADFLAFIYMYACTLQLEGLVSVRRG